MVIALDMDGTLADLYNVPNWLESLHSEDVTPYKVAEPLCDTEALASALRLARTNGHTVEVLSWNCKGDISPEYRRKVRKAKVHWLKQHGLLDEVDAVHVVKHGTPKSKVASGQGVLFDDETANRNEWSSSGRGVAFDAVNLVARIEQIVRQYN
jgi:hypothetical protein